MSVALITVFPHSVYIMLFKNIFVFKWNASILRGLWEQGAGVHPALLGHNSLMNQFSLYHLMKHSVLTRTSEGFPISYCFKILMLYFLYSSILRVSKSQTPVPRLTTGSKLLAIPKDPRIWLNTAVGYFAYLSCFSVWVEWLHSLLCFCKHTAQGHRPRAEGV